MEQIEKRKISHIEIHRMICEKCGAEMVQSHDANGNPVVITNPSPQYVYTCPKCGNSENHVMVMPYTEFMFGGIIE